MMMVMNYEMIDEINAYKNEDGSFRVEIQSCANNQYGTMVIPNANLHFSLSCAVNGTAKAEIVLEGDL